MADAKSTSEKDARVKQDLNSKLQDALADVSSLQEQVDEEQDAKKVLQDKVNKAMNEITEIKKKHETEESNRIVDLENSK